MSARNREKMSSYWCFVCGCLPLLVSSCWLAAQSSVPDSGRTSGTKEQPSPISDEPMIFQARVGIGPVGKEPTTIIDYEVAGPGRAGRRACEALVQKELSTEFPTDTNLKVSSIRACDVTPLLEPDAKSSYALVRVTRMTGMDVRLQVPASADLKADGVQVRKRELMGYSDKDSCESELQKLREAADKAGRDSAMSFLEEQISQQEKRATESCGKDKNASACRTGQTLLGSLKERRIQIQNGSSVERTASVNMICRRW